MVHSSAMALKYRVYSTDDSSSSIVTGLTLDRLLQKIGAPVDEEQAWALCHQCFISLSVCCSNFPIVPISAKNTVLTVEGDIRFLAGKEERKSIFFMKHQICVHAFLTVGKMPVFFFFSGT